MVKRISLVLVLAAACKSADKPAPAAEPARTGTPTQPAPSGPPPALPSEPEARAPEGPRPTLPTTTPDDEMKSRWERRMKDVDTNGDGQISDEERMAARKARMTNMRADLDANGDGKLTPAELTSAGSGDDRRRRMRFDDPAALDVDGNGDISEEELAAGIRARRDQWRGPRGQWGRGSGQPE